MKDVLEPPPPSATAQEVQQLQSFAEESVKHIIIIEWSPKSDKNNQNNRQKKHNSVLSRTQIQKPLPKTTPVSSPSSSSHDEEVVLAPKVTEIPLSAEQKSGTRNCDS
jgi:hypothetical protein